MQINHKQTIRLKDNHLYTHKDYPEISNLSSLWINNLSLREIADDSKYPNLLVFPHSLGEHGDDIKEQKIFSSNTTTLRTGNISGFIGVDGIDIHITSRFSDGDEDFLLHYLLCRKFNINLFNLKSSTTDVPVLDLLILLFPYYLKRALSQGVFKKYKRFKRNDANIRGTIDISRHIKSNIPFTGSVAYNTREYSYDNDVTQLVRHTAEYLMSTPLGRMIINNDATIREGIQQIKAATPSFNPREINNIINRNLRPASHPYFSAYSQLQKICLQILLHKKLKYGAQNKQEKIYGVLFDVAWLWEEYLAVILKDLGFTHSLNKVGGGGKDIFKDKNILPPKNEEEYKYKGRIFPDFHYTPKNKTLLILDAKYKPLNKGVNKDDLYQMITYMHCYEAPHGGFVYPSVTEQRKDSDLNITRKEVISIIPFPIPQNKESWEAFCEDMENNERKFQTIWQHYQ